MVQLTPMLVAELLQQVQTAAALDPATAEQVSLATVTTLAERIGVEPQAAWMHLRAPLGTLERGGGRDGRGPPAAAARL